MQLRSAIECTLLCLALCSLSVVLRGAQAASNAQWQSRTIYQLLTDRFENPSSSSPCDNLDDYCGGTFAGMVSQIKYIQDMGFDAIWISPIPQNTPQGYHGYWAENLDIVNPMFGGMTGLKSFVAQAHAAGMYVMLDVVGNHMGPVCSSATDCNFSTLVPFSTASDFHDCSQCPSNCQIADYTNQQQVQLCRLAGLPDLNQSDPGVARQLTSWVKSTVQQFDFDGLRIDTVPEVNKAFWNDFVQAAGTYAVGEVFNGDTSYVASYQQPTGPLPGVLSYPLYFTLRNVFAQQQSMYALQTLNKAYRSAMGNINLTGSFVDNHDNERFLFVQGDTQLYKNALLYTLFAEGIPIVYYGSEQAYAQENQRAPLWTSGFDQTNDMYQFIKTAIGIRKNLKVWNYQQIQRYAQQHFYAFTRGQTFIALTNAGTNGQPVTHEITFDNYAEGTKLCNQFDLGDCVIVNNQMFNVTLTGGGFKVYAPASQ